MLGAHVNGVGPCEVELGKARRDQGSRGRGQPGLLVGLQESDRPCLKGVR